MTTGPFDDDAAIDAIRSELARLTPSTRKRVLEKFGLAALGSIPWVGGFISAAVTLKTEEGQLRATSLQTEWLKEHATKLEELERTLNEIAARFDQFGAEVEERIQSEEYLDLVRRAFRTWDTADTERKRKCAANLVTNAAGTRLVSDDVVRLFVDWLDNYHESHLAIIQEIYQQPGSTRRDVWEALYGDIPREDSAEADLYRLLIRDLSTGGVIRQARETTADGEFLKKRPQRRRGAASSRTMESAFEDSKPYILTELGKQFVHYTLTEATTRLENGE